MMRNKIFYYRRDNDDQINYNHVEIQEQFQDEERRQTIAEEIITFLYVIFVCFQNKSCSFIFDITDEKYVDTSSMHSLRT